MAEQDPNVLYAPWRMEYIRSLHQSGGEECFLCAAAAASTEDVETVFWILRHLAANPGRGVVGVRTAGASAFDVTYRIG